MTWAGSVFENTNQGSPFFVCHFLVRPRSNTSFQNLGKVLSLEEFDILFVLSSFTSFIGEEETRLDKKYQIFISSTYKDLIPERKKVCDVILSMYHFPIGMEMFNAADEEQWEIIKETIDSSDYYVLIIGKRYGSVIPEGQPDAGISYTEKEYRYAVSRGIPILTFIKEESAITVDKSDTDPVLIEKLNALQTEITNIKEADWFSNEDDLGTKVSLALHKQMDRKKRPGWVRGDRFDMDASLNEIVVLSQRVRELEEENRKLREVAVPRQPALSVSIKFAGTIEEPLALNEDKATDDIKAKETNDSLLTFETVQRKEVSKKGYLKNTDPLTMEDVPADVKNLISQEILDKYNSQLPDKKTVEDYEKKMCSFNEVQKNGQLLDFIISNVGTAKATDVNVTLEFPKSFFIMKRREAKEWTAPKKPRMPQNPIEETRARKFFKDNAGRQLQQISHLIGDSYAFGPKPIDISAALLESNCSAYWSVDIEGTKVKVWCKNLLHTHTQTVDELCIIPMEKGIFKIKVSMMCEEYFQPEESELELAVE